MFPGHIYIGERTDKNHIYSQICVRVSEVKLTFFAAVYVIGEDGCAYQNVEQSTHASDQTLRTDTAVSREEVQRSSDGAVVPISDVGLIESSSESDSGSDVDRVLSRWLDYREYAVVPMSQKNASSVDSEDTTEPLLQALPCGDDTENTESVLQVLPFEEDTENTEPVLQVSAYVEDTALLSSATAKEDIADVTQDDGCSFETLDTAIVPLSEAADEVFEQVDSSSTPAACATDGSLEGAVVPLTETPDEVDDSVVTIRQVSADDGPVVRRMSVDGLPRNVRKRDSATEADGDYRRDIAAVVELLVGVIASSELPA